MFEPFAKFLKFKQPRRHPRLKPRYLGPSMLVILRLHTGMAHSKYSYYVPGETISYPVVVLFQCSVTSIVTGPIFISGVYLRIGDRLFYCVGDFENYLGSVFGESLLICLKTCLICFWERFVQTTRYPFSTIFLSALRNSHEWHILLFRTLPLLLAVLYYIPQC